MDASILAKDSAISSLRAGRRFTLTGTRQINDKPNDVKNRGNEIIAVPNPESMPTSGGASRSDQNIGGFHARHGHPTATKSPNRFLSHRKASVH